MGYPRVVDRPTGEELAAGATIGQRYTIVRLLGRGGMGEVYLVTDMQLHRPVALKLLPVESAADPERRARFDREARLAAALRHPHICTIHEIGEAEGRPFIAMEYVEGKTLRDKCASGPLAVDETLTIAVQIADALDDAHTHHIVHRDLKSANIVITARGDVKILDFGLAKRVPGVDGATPEVTTAADLSQAGLVVGTIAYMSPEQALGQPVDHRSDLFSFGVVLYEMLTGRLPFAGHTSVAVINAILNEAPPAMPRFNERVPDGLVGVVTKLLEKDRERRYQSAREVRIDLERVARERGPSAVAEVRLDGTRRPMKRLGWMAAAAVLVAVVAGASWLLWNMSRQSSALQGAASIVVLPAEVFGPPDFQYLADAVPATLSSHLAEIAELETKVPPTHLEWDAVKRDAQQMVRAYAVALYIAPHVYVQGDRLSMTFQLVQGSTRKMIWSHDYAGTPDTYLAEIRQAADDLRGVLRPEAQQIVAPLGRTANSEAELAFQQGTHFWHRFNNLHEQQDFDVSLASLTRALQLDPTLADAAAEVAMLYVFKLEEGAPLAEMHADIERWARRSLAINPQCGIGWAALSILELYNQKSDNRVMLEDALRAAKYAPRTPIAQNILGIALQADTLSIEGYRQALALDPFYRAAADNLADTLFQLDRSSQALAVIDNIIAREPALARSFVGLQVGNFANLGRLDEAQALFTRMLATAPGDFVTRVTEIALLLARGDPTADAKIDAILDLLSQPTASTNGVVAVTGRLLPLFGRYDRRDAAFRLLTLGAQRDRLPAYDSLATDDRLASLRRDPRFRPLLERSKADLAIMLTILDAARARNELPGYLERPLRDLRARLGM